MSSASSPAVTDLHDNFEDDASEVWTLLKAFSPDELKSSPPKMCSTNDCFFPAACLWNSGKGEAGNWLCCEQCQEEEFGGWPGGSRKAWVKLDRALAKSKAEKEENAPPFPSFVSGLTPTGLAKRLVQVKPALSVSPPLVVNNNNNNGDNDDGDDDDRKEVWLLISAYSTEESKSNKCSGDDCESNAITLWNNGLGPKGNWKSCEKCQDNEFGGWPGGSKKEWMKMVVSPSPKSEKGKEKEKKPRKKAIKCSPSPSSSSASASTSTPSKAKNPSTTPTAPATPKPRKSQAPAPPNSQTSPAPDSRSKLNVSVANTLAKTAAKIAKKASSDAVTLTSSLSSNPTADPSESLLTGLAAVKASKVCSTAASAVIQSAALSSESTYDTLKSCISAADSVAAIAKAGANALAVAKAADPVAAKLALQAAARSELSAPQSRSFEMMDISPADGECGGGGEGDGEAWCIISAYSIQEMSQTNARACQSNGCTLPACACWRTANGKSEWTTCEECQLRDFGGWPEGWPNDENTVITSTTTSASASTTTPCADAAGFDALDMQVDGAARPDPQSKPNDDDDDDCDDDEGGTPPRSSLPSIVSPEPTQPPKPKKASKETIAIQKKWKDEASKLGLPSDRQIITTAPAAVPVIHKFLYDLMKPANINTIHSELKGLIPAPLLKKTIDMMVFTGETLTSALTKPIKSKDKGKCLRSKVGKNAGTTVFFVFEDDASDAFERAWNETVYEELKRKVRAEGEEAAGLAKAIAKLEKEPLNVDLAGLLDRANTEIDGIQENIDFAKATFTDDGGKKKALEASHEFYVKEWIVRKRKVMDGVMLLESATDGAISLKKVFGGDGPLCLESDEQIQKDATACRVPAAFGGKKGGKMGGVKRKLGASGGGRALELSSGAAASAAEGGGRGANFVALRLDSTQKRGVKKLYKGGYQDGKRA